jgi:hypothetical protein
MASGPPSGQHTSAQATGEAEGGTGSEQGQRAGDFFWVPDFDLGEGVLE